MPREMLDRATITGDVIREQIEIRQRIIADLDKDIVGFLANPEGEVVNMKTWATCKGRTAAKRVRKIRDRTQAEIDALQTELDRRAGNN